MFSVDVAKVAKGFLLSSVFIGVLGLSACGGGGGGSDNPTSSETPSSVDNIVTTSESLSARENALAVSFNIKPNSRNEATRFLLQSTFGPSQSDVDRLMSIGYSAWFNEQVAAPTNISYRTYWEQRNLTLKSASNSSANTAEITHAFWANALGGKDQLRQRVALALSEIFVVSTTDGCGANNPIGVASYMDTLSQRAFGKYRDLLEAVTLHPMMGCYLSHLRNQKEDITTGRIPDENFAREVMQLFSIGLVKLNPDGTAQLDGSGRPVETYNAADITGLAKVFTGWSFDCPDYPSDNCFRFAARVSDGATYSDRWARQMRPYPRFHSVSEKRFLGTLVPAQSSADPQASLRVALDTIAKHPNVGPFIGKQLIQRLVTANPSPAYVRRVAAAFNESGGSLQATVSAILADPEARDTGTALSSPTFGKVREPILKLSAFLRAYGVTSATGSYLMWSTNDPATGLGQGILQAPSVFNYFRPGYTPPNTQTSGKGLVSPEMQIIHETTSASYVNFMRNAISTGLGSAGYDNRGSVPDIRVEYQVNEANSSSLALADRPLDLVESINVRLMYGTMSAALKSEIVRTITTIEMRAGINPTAKQILDTRKTRLYSALLLTVASPEFQVQK